MKTIYGWEMSIIITLTLQNRHLVDSTLTYLYDKNEYTIFLIFVNVNSLYFSQIQINIIYANINLSLNYCQRSSRSMEYKNGQQ